MCVLSNTAQLLGPQANTALALRLDAEHIISTIAKALIKDMPLFEKGERNAVACHCYDVGEGSLSIWLALCLDFMKNRVQCHR